MRNLILKVIFFLSLIALTIPVAFAGASAKVMVMDFQLNDLTDLPNAPEELARIGYLSSTFKQKLVDNGVELVPVNNQLKAELSGQSPTYLFDRVEHAAKLAEGSGADYLLIAVALKPTYLFVYPRILLVDIKTQKVVMAKASQLESSWLDKNTTARSAEKLADMVSEELKKLAGQAN
ncbi:MAG: DUF2380 domain-containing protein [Methylotenera sp.]|nr:DUF2380 domain-containing protein [Methylotenera sp.]